MTKLWHLLTQELGSAFKNQYGLAGGAPFNHWAHELRFFSEAELVAGLEKFKASGKTYISLSVFRSHCMGEKKEPRPQLGPKFEKKPVAIAHDGSRLKKIGNETLEKLKRAIQ